MKSGQDNLFSHLLLAFSGGDPKGRVEGVAYTPLHTEQNGEKCHISCSNGM